MQQLLRETRSQIFLVHDELLEDLVLHVHVVLHTFSQYVYAVIQNTRACIRRYREPHRYRVSADYPRVQLQFISGERDHVVNTRPEELEESVTGDEQLALVELRKHEVRQAPRDGVVSRSQLDRQHLLLVSKFALRRHHRAQPRLDHRQQQV